MVKNKKNDGVILKESLINALEGMKLSKDKSEMISGGNAQHLDQAWICIGAGCNPACNTSCTNCIGPDCTINYG